MTICKLNYYVSGRGELARNTTFSHMQTWVRWVEAPPHRITLDFALKDASTLWSPFYYKVTDIGGWIGHNLLLFGLKMIMPSSLILILLDEVMSNRS